MSLKDLIFELIDLRSFSNLWYWIMLAVFWSSASRWVLGIPFDLIDRSRRQDEAAQRDLAVLAEINVTRILHLYRSSGLTAVMFAAFLLSSLFVFAWYYWSEIAQAVFLITAPASILGIMSLQLAKRLESDRPEITGLVRSLIIHRMKTQVLGMISIFLTAVFGMYQNIQIGVLG